MPVISQSGNVFAGTLLVTSSVQTETGVFQVTEYVISRWLIKNTKRITAVSFVTVQYWKSYDNVSYDEFSSKNETKSIQNACGLNLGAGQCH
jgi:hypothetical protein